MGAGKEKRRKLVGGRMLKKLIFLLVLFSVIIVGTNVYAEKMRIALQEEVDSSIEIPEFIQENLKNKIREKINNSKKFDVIMRNQKDIKRLLEEQKFSDERIGRVDTEDEKRAQYGKFAGVEYFVSVDIKDFYEGMEEARFKKVKSEDKHFVRLEVGLRLLHASTGRIKLEKSLVDKESKQVGGYYDSDISSDRETVNKLIDKISGKIVKEILNELYPIKILKKMGNSVFLNRGEESGIKKGSELEVFAIEKVKDEDTDEEVNLEMPVGKIRITSASGKTSQGEIIEDMGINVENCIARVTTEESLKAKVIKKNIEEKEEDDEDW